MSSGLSPPMLILLWGWADISTLLSNGGIVPFIFLHFGSTTSNATVVFIILGGIASSVLASVSVLVFSQRRSRPYLFVSLALGMLAAKAFVGGLTVFDVMSASTHHMVEHALDFATALCLIAAIFFARMTTNTAVDHSHTQSDHIDDKMTELGPSSDD